jgi:hypothetical protein
MENQNLEKISLGFSSTELISHNINIKYLMLQGNIIHAQNLENLIKMQQNY